MSYPLSSTWNLLRRIESKEGIYTDLEMESLLKTAAPDPTNSELIRMQNEISRGIPFQPYENYPKKGAYKICFTSTTLKAVDETKKILRKPIPIRRTSIWQ